jgi:hypothetical protein
VGQDPRISRGPGLTDPREGEERLRSAKAVAAMMILAAVVLAAGLVFLWVVFSRACA